jgi:PAS domain S-box-containing protein
LDTQPVVTRTEQDLLDFVDTAAIGLHWVAADGTILWANPADHELLGYSAEEYIGKNIVEFHADEHVIADILRRLSAGERLKDYTARLRCKDGSTREVLITSSVRFDEERTFVHTRCFTVDVTEKRREEERRRFLVEAGALLSSSLDYVPTLKRIVELSVPKMADWCAVDMIESGGELERLATAHVNPAKLERTKVLQICYSPDARSALHEVIRTGRSQLLADIPDSLSEDTAAISEHVRLQRELGLRSAMIIPLRARGRTLGALTFVSAESNRRFGDADLAFAEELANVAALAVENARLYREAQNANRTKDEFLATVSHELRTPLNAILGWASLLRTSEVTSEKRAHALEVIERNARSQAQLIEDLLDVSRIISGALRLESRAVDLATIIESALDAVRLAAESKGVQIRVALDDDARRATGDAGRLQQIVWNLVSNAVKFTGRGGAVSVRLARVESRAEIHVSDTGHGIAAEFLPHIFERFKQADATTTRSHAGLGLGLAIVKHLVELHGGTVTATSGGSGQGAMFRVQLPLAAVMREDVTALGPSVVSRIVAPRLDGLRVLVVDDELDARTLLTAVLETHGAQVEAAASAQDALARLESFGPDVLVSDIGMPGEDGYSLIHKVRALTKNGPKAIPAAALTAFARKEDRARAMLAGFQSHIAKPIDPDELLIVVATLAGRTND